MGEKGRGIDSTRNDLAERKRWKWEWLRRNEEYRKDFKKHGKFLERGLKKHNDKVLLATKRNINYIPLPPPYSDIYEKMHTKWPLVEGLRNPNDPWTEKLRIVANSPLGQDVSVSFTDKLFLELEFEGEESLTSKNCPHCLVIFARVTPWLQKAKLIKAINQTAKENLGKLLEAQKSIYGRRSLRPRFDEFEKYKNVYDLRHPKEGKGKSWRKIALEVLSGDVKIDSAIRKVRYYHDQADWWIKEGWRML